MVGLSRKRVFFPKQKGTPSLVKIEHKNTATLDSARSKKKSKVAVLQLCYTMIIRSSQVIVAKSSDKYEPYSSKKVTSCFSHVCYCCIFILFLWERINWVRVFTGSGLITGSDRIGPDRARNWPIPLLN